MAWTDQCRIAFQVNAKGLYLTQKGRKNLTKVLKNLSRESGIPYKTLERWWYEEKSERKKESLKNEETRGRPTKLQQKRPKKRDEPSSDKDFIKATNSMKKILQALKK